MIDNYTKENNYCKHCVLPLIDHAGALGGTSAEKDPILRKKFLPQVQ